MESSEVVRRAPFGDNPTVGLRGASTQRRILSTALEVFAEHGYHDARVELITEAAGCSRPAFYQYFSSKEDLFWRIAGHLANDMGELAEGVGAITPDADGVNHLEQWLEAFIDLCSDYEPILSGYQAAARDRPPDAKGTRDIGNRVGVAIVKSVGPDHPELELPALTNAVVGIVIRSIYYWGIGLGQLPRSRFVTGLAQTVHRLLVGPIDGVNVTKTVNPPTRRAPAWPEFPGSSDDDPSLRPRGRKTRQKLLDAGSRVLPQRGYHDTRVDDVVQEAGVSHGSFYRYFANKDELFHVLAEDAATTMVEMVSTFPEGADTERLHRWLSGWFGSYRHNGGVISAWQEIDYEAPDLRAFSLEVAVVAFDRLQRIIHQREFGDSTVDAIVMLSVIERIPYSVFVLKHLEEEEALAASSFIIRRGLLGMEPAVSR